MMIPAVLSRFEIEISCLQGVTGALRAQPSAVSLRPYVPHRLCGPTWPRVAFACRPSGLPTRLRLSMKLSGKSCIAKDCIGNPLACLSL